jgi:hypothetical protein
MRTRDDADPVSGAVGDEIERPAEQLRPRQSARPYGRRVRGRLERGLPGGRGRGREAEPKTGAVGKYARVPDEVEVGRRQEGGETAEEGVGLEEELGAAGGSGPGLGQAVADAAVGVPEEAVEGEGGAEAVPAELLEPLAVVGGDGAFGVKVEAVDGGAEGLAEGLRGEGRGEGVTGDPGGLLEGGVEVGELVVVRGEVNVDGGATALEEGGEALHEAGGEAGDVVVGGGREGDELEASAGCRVTDEEAIGRDGVEVGMEVERGSEALDERDGAGVTVDDPLGPTATPQPGKEGAAEDAEGGREEGGVAGEREAEGPGEGEDPLAVGDGREDSVDEVGGRIGHAPPPARRAKAAVAGSWDEALLAALRAF